MIRYSRQLAFHIAGAATLVASACWFATDSGWEQALALLGGIVAWAASLGRVLTHHFVSGEASQIAKLPSDKSLAKLVGPSLRALAENEPKDTNDMERFLAGAYGLLFRRLRLLEVDERGQLCPVSQRARLFLHALAHTATGNVGFAGDWKAEGTQNESARNLGEILTRTEEFRIKAFGGIAKTPAAREVSSSLVLVKAMWATAPVFLLRWSDAWGGYFWFVGGIQEAADGSPEVCARRELKQELGLAESAVQLLVPVASVKDKRVSARLGVLTDYTYHLFSVAIDDDDTSAANLLTKEFAIEKTVGGGYQVCQKCEWLTWDEIKASPNLIQDAGEILRAIEAFGPDRVPLSLRKPVV